MKTPAHLTKLLATMVASVIAVMSICFVPAAWAQGSSGKKASQPTHITAQQKKASTVKKSTVSRSVAKTKPRKKVKSVAYERPSVGQMAGLHRVHDPLDLRSNVALVLDQDTQEVLVNKNTHAVLPIASLTKLMTALVVADADLNPHELITISLDDVDTEKGSTSRLRVGTILTRDELLHLALMSSENRAAHALGRTFPGGMQHFVELMNAKARQLGMRDTRFIEPTGLSSLNRSTAPDLAKLVTASMAYPIVRDYSTSSGLEVAVGNRYEQYNNTNRLVLNPNWEIGLQKTGFISEAGRCLVMQARVAGRQLVMVFLDSAGKFSRLGDAERVKRWLESQSPSRAQKILSNNTVSDIAPSL